MEKYRKCPALILKPTYLAPGETPLHLAIGQKNLRMVRVLLDSGADTTLTDQRLRDGLHAAVDASGIFIFSQGIDRSISL